MTKLIRQKLGNSKRRLLAKVTEVKEVLEANKDVTKYDAAKYSMELEKKRETFQRHVEELEAAVDGNEAERERFFNEYDELDEL